MAFYCKYELLFFFFNDPATTEIYTYFPTLSLHDALPFCLPRLPPCLQDRLPTSDPVIEAIRKRTDLAAWFMGNARRACARSRLFIMSFPILFLSGVSALVLSAIPFTAAHAAAGGDPSIIVTAQSATDEARSEIEKRPGGVDVVSADSFKDKVAVSLRDALAFSPGVYTQPRFGQIGRAHV